MPTDASGWCLDCQAFRFHRDGCPRWSHPVPYKPGRVPAKIGYGLRSPQDIGWGAWRLANREMFTYEHRCTRCDEPGHNALTCPRKPRCSLCGQPGHKFNTCAMQERVSLEAYKKRRAELRKNRGYR